MSSNKVVTAAHCFADKVTGQKMSKDELEKFTIVVGTDDPFGYYGNSYRKQRLDMHDSYVCYHQPQLLIENFMS